MSLVWIALGGSVGAICRYLVATGIFQWMGKPFPYGTLSVNLIGSFLIGIAYVLLIQQQWGSEHYKQLAIVGFLGAFTTFSSFSLESVALLQQERWLAFLAYTSSSLVGCLAATAVGIYLTTLLTKGSV